MHIISRYRDYYDNISPGDRAPVWIRHTSSERIALPSQKTREPLFQILLQMPAPEKWLASHYPVVIAFCGRAYRGYSNGGDCCWTAQVLEEEMRLEWARLVGWRKSQGKLPYHARKFLQVAADDFSTRPEIPAEQHRSWGSPVVMLSASQPRNPELVRNPRLDWLDFATIVDPYTAWQELDMYLGNQLAQQPRPPQERSQELIRDAHGFDTRSFRQGTPGEKKRRRKANKARKRRAE